MSCARRQATIRWRSTSRTTCNRTTIGLPCSARPLHIGRCAGCNFVRVTYASIRNVISAIERERTTPAVAALAQHSKRQINGDLDRHVPDSQDPPERRHVVPDGQHVEILHRRRDPETRGGGKALARRPPPKMAAPVYQ